MIQIQYLSKLISNCEMNVSSFPTIIQSLVEIVFSLFHLINGNAVLERRASPLHTVIL